MLIRRLGDVLLRPFGSTGLGFGCGLVGMDMGVRSYQRCLLRGVGAMTLCLVCEDTPKPFREDNFCNVEMFLSYTLFSFFS